MKIKRLGLATFKIETDTVSVLTDPGSVELTGKRGSKAEADIVLISSDNDRTLLEEITPENRENVFKIDRSGEYEILGMMVQRPVEKSYYILDYDYIRVVYLGMIGNQIDPSDYEDLGDVDVLLMPVGNSNLFPDYEKLQEVISNVDPKVLIPYGYKEEGMKGEIAENLKSKDEFLKYFGFTNYKEEKSVRIDSRPESEEWVMDVVLLN